MSMRKNGRMRVSRRELLRSGSAVAALGTLAGVGGCVGDLLPGVNKNRVTAGDVAILRFLAAAELIETDLWEQYCELGENNDAYAEALEAIDDDMVEYVCDNTADEQSHAQFLNAYLESIGEKAVDLAPYRTLTPPGVRGLSRKKRLTDLTRLTVDTSYVERYLGAGNPDFGDSFEQVVDIRNRPAIPTSDSLNDTQLRAAANVAALHFGSIEQGGTSLYVNMLSRVSSADAVKIVASIGPTEAWHFTIWRDVLGGITALDTGDGLVFPDLSADEDIVEHVMPNPCRFFAAGLPRCSVIRPSATANAGAVAAVAFLTNSGLFKGQSQAFFDAIGGLALAADAAVRV